MMKEKNLQETTTRIRQIFFFVFLLISMESRRINKDLKGAEVQKYHRGDISRAGNPFEIIDTGETGSVPSFSSACNSLPFSRSAPPMMHGVPSDQSQGCLVLSHCYNECYCVSVTLFPALISPRVILSPLDCRHVEYPDMKHVKIETIRYLIERLIFMYCLVLFHIKCEIIFFQNNRQLSVESSEKKK